ncbi:uncharacterized protein Z520_06371 [Fonsecaea multimorphosa CBS 102226]|uniref:Enoyl reductase (ER) domain-containing protein n=1 Tax=Fonsecaea multimorphosa CBS 102226 TaxID=1442371 RepID=A0A0D2K380_9EURO|nr:uncharacterized protein Z520_06371 [Fonsecaea multimorphosa CBS 102226]KIX97594.1 hypothetical protein Z520_06371 [Fonsecaea multimorphosa CBS 102226]
MAVNGLSGQHTNNVPLWIDNKPVQSKKTFPVFNSTTQKEVWTASSASVEIAREAVDSASKAFQSWTHTHPTDRRRIFFKAAELFRSRADEIIETMVQETNCPRQWAAAINVHLGVEFLEEFASLATTCSMGSLPTTESENRLALVFKEPYGVVLGIAPWNAAFILALRAVTPPIICGNTAVLKASELCPKTHNIIGQVFRDAGLPSGVLNIIQHSREDAAEVVNALIAHPAVRKINFTGSTAVGRIIAQQAGRHLKPVLLELGGKASCIILEDADLVKAAKAVVMGGFLHHGQTCMATERVIVMRPVAEKFLEILKKEAQAFVAGNAVSIDGAKRTESLVQAAVDQGAHLEFGHVSRLNASLQPTILSGVTKDMALFHDESFGPTLTLTTVDTVDEAVALANDTGYGLSTSIFSQNIPRALKCARRMETGACHINSMTIHDEPCLPHGGSKQSGFGRFGAQWGMDEFLQVKTITILDEGNRNRGPALPAILGHEGSGVVEQAGSEVKHVAVGDHVLLSFSYCGSCVPCRRGNVAYCRKGPHFNFGGSRLDGSKPFSLNGTEINSSYFGQSSFAARSIVRGVCAVKVPPNVPLDILCCLGCGIQTGAGTVLNLLKPFVGASVAVFGVGSVGLAAIMAAANFTPATKVIAIDIVDSRLQLATELGATHTINSTGKDVVAMIKDVTNGEGVDCALDATGNVAVIESMIAAAANNGTVATVGGAPRGKFVNIEAAAWIGRNVSYVGSCQGSSFPREFLPILVDFWSQGRFPIDRLVTKYPYTEINQAIADMHHGKCIKPVLVWE